MHICIQAKVTSSFLHSSKRCLLHAWIQERILSCMLHSGKRYSCMHSLRLGYTPAYLHSSRNTTATLHLDKSILFCNMHSEYCSFLMHSWIQSTVLYDTQARYSAFRQESWCNAPHEQYHVNNIRVLIFVFYSKVKCSLLLEESQLRITESTELQIKSVIFYPFLLSFLLPIITFRYMSILLMPN